MVTRTRLSSAQQTLVRQRMQEGIHLGVVAAFNKAIDQLEKDQRPRYAMYPSEVPAWARGTTPAAIPKAPRYVGKRGPKSASMSSANTQTALPANPMALLLVEALKTPEGQVLIREAVRPLLAGALTELGRLVRDGR